jgi:hypothetical protein
MGKIEKIKKTLCEKINWFCDDPQTLNSIAIWWNNSNDIKVHVDLNIWHTKESKNNYLELGLKINGYKNLNEVHIYIPYLIKLEDVEDKVSLLSLNPLLTSAMFNEKLDMTSSNNSFCPVRFSHDHNKDFEYCKIDRARDIDVIDNHIINSTFAHKT